MTEETTPKPDAPRPLDGVTIVDLSRVLSGPFCTMQLADMGARVIKIERPGRGDDTREWGPPFLNGESSYFLSINRNKESVALDFKHPAGRAILDRLIAKADVLVENFHPGTLEKIGLGYRDLCGPHPGLIYCSITGYGLTGPNHDRPGYDAVIQAEGGLMSLTGAAGGEPYRLGVPIADLVTGMFAAQGITLALMVRARTGRGQHVDIGMLDSVAALLTSQAGIYFATGSAPTRLGNQHPSIAPYDAFDAADGTLILAVGNDEQWLRFCELSGLGELGADPRFATNADRVRRYPELRPTLEKVLRTRSRQDWIALLVPSGVPCTSVRDLGEVLTDPQLLARSMVGEMSHPSAGRISTLGTPVKLSGTPARLASPPPRLGEHTARVLEGTLGLSPPDVADLQRQGVVELAPPLP
jgi:crotonobetainyl-CoA:carnitine CoA-transferase CaiB-like acyl-CoA transferase